MRIAIAIAITIEITIKTTTKTHRIGVFNGNCLHKPVYTALAKLNTINRCNHYCHPHPCHDHNTQEKPLSPVNEVMGEEVSIIVEVVRQEEVVVHSGIPGNDAYSM